MSDPEGRKTEGNAGGATFSGGPEASSWKYTSLAGEQLPKSALAATIDPAASKHQAVRSSAEGDARGGPLGNVDGGISTGGRSNVSSRAGGRKESKSPSLRVGAGAAGIIGEGAADGLGATEGPPIFTGVRTLSGAVTLGAFVDRRGAVVEGRDGPPVFRLGVVTVGEEV